MTDTVKVTALGQTYKHQGKGFGPFQGTSDRPFLEVPLAVALASGAPVYTGEEAEAQAEGDDLAGQVDRLTAEVRHLTDERNDLQFKLDHKSEIIERGMADNKRLADQAGASNENSFRLKGELDTVTAERDAMTAAHQMLGEEVDKMRDTFAAELATAQARPALPDDARERLIAVKGVGEKLADEVLAVLKAPVQ